MKTNLTTTLHSNSNNDLLNKLYKVKQTLTSDHIPNANSQFKEFYNDLKKNSSLSNEEARNCLTANGKSYINLPEYMKEPSSYKDYCYTKYMIKTDLKTQDSEEIKFFKNLLNMDKNGMNTYELGIGIKMDIILFSLLESMFTKDFKMIDFLLDVTKDYKTLKDKVGSNDRVDNRDKVDSNESAHIEQSYRLSMFDKIFDEYYTKELLALDESSLYLTPEKKAIICDFVLHYDAIKINIMSPDIILRPPEETNNSAISSWKNSSQLVYLNFLASNNNFSATLNEMLFLNNWLIDIEELKKYDSTSNIPRENNLNKEQDNTNKDTKDNTLLGLIKITSYYQDILNKSTADINIAMYERGLKSLHISTDTFAQKTYEYENTNALNLTQKIRYSLSKDIIHLAKTLFKDNNIWHRSCLICKDINPEEAGIKDENNNLIHLNSDTWSELASYLNDCICQDYNQGIINAFEYNIIGQTITCEEVI